MEYAKIPKTINYQDVINHKNKSLSPNDHITIKVNCNYELLEKFIIFSTMGKEVGSFNYMENSNLKFIRTKCLQGNSILLNLSEAIGLNPSKFRNFSLSKGNILLVKDSNIGEVCYLDKDLPNYAISGGVVKIELNDELDKFYIIGIMKSSFFKEQIDLMTPKGATIRHSKDVYKYAKIPIPADKKIIDKISILTQSLIKKERELRDKFKQINKDIEEELKNNQKLNTFHYKLPTYNDIKKHNRLDTGLYTKEFKEIEFIIKNYSNGFYYLNKNYLKSGATPKENERIMNTGKINWITPTNITDYGTMNIIPKIAIKSQSYNIQRDCIVFINRTSKGNKGEYVGISYFYDYKELGKGQHNQGLYRLENQPKYKLLFLTSYMNSKFARKLCSNISMGSKMKEIKSMDFEKIPIPLFDNDKQKAIAKLYSNQSDNYLKHINQFEIEEFNNIDLKVNANSGILDLDLQIKAIKEIINQEIKIMVSL